MRDYLNPSRIYTDGQHEVGVSKMESTTPTVKESLTTQPTIDIDTGVAGYVEPICSGKSNPTAPIRENVTTALEWFRDEITALYLWAMDPCLVEPLTLYKREDARAIAEYFQAAIDALSKTAESAKILRVGEPDYPTANGRQVKNATGTEEIALGTLGLQVGTAKPGSEILPNCGTEPRQSAEWTEQGVTVTTASSHGAPITYKAIRFPGVASALSPYFLPCEYCNGTCEQKPLFHENNYEPHTCMQSYIEISEAVDGKKRLLYVDLWDGANAVAAFEINYCPMCGAELRKRSNEND